jgi:hypothetical protein
MALGDPITRGVPQQIAATQALDPRNAAALAISAYLENAVFVVAGEAPEGSEEPSAGLDQAFRLDKVTHVWPSGSEPITYPSASIIESGTPKYAQDLTPYPLDDTWGKYGEDTVLWHLREESVTFQIDYWCNSDPTREAIAAHIEQLFSPDEDLAGVLIEGPPEYFCLSIRATLEDVRRMDTSETTLTRERRLMTTVVADVPVVQLRRAVALEPQVHLDETEN